MNLKIQMVVWLLALSWFVVACDTFKDEVTSSSNANVEVPKSLDGIWRLKTVSRNGVDITNTMEFSQFHLILNKDSTYVIDNYLPFLVKNNGTWATDDLLYPFFLIFKQEGCEDEAKTEITYPIVKGKRQITLSLSPGCARNSYVYSFEKVEE